MKKVHYLILFSNQTVPHPSIVKAAVLKGYLIQFPIEAGHLDAQSGNSHAGECNRGYSS